MSDLEISANISIDTLSEINQSIRTFREREDYPLLQNADENNQNISNLKYLDQYLLCPRCNIYIPSLPFFVNPAEKGSVEILINCKCGNKDRMPLEDYFNYKLPTPKISKCEICRSNKPNLDFLFCVTCSRWVCNECREVFYEEEQNHYYSKNYVVFSEYCEEHINKKKLFYCLNCKEEFCSKCSKNHNNEHNIIDLTTYYQTVQNLILMKNLENNINDFFKKNEKIKEKCLEIIENLNNVNGENNIDKKEKFLELYNKNYNLNIQLKNFLNILYNSFLAASTNPNYNIIHNIEHSSDININAAIEIEKLCEDLTISSEIKYEQIINYFSQNYLLQIKSLLYIKEEKSHYDNFSVKLLLKLNDESFLFTSDTFFQVYNTNTKEISQKIIGHTREITKIIKLNDGKIATGSKDTQIRIWNVDPYIMLAGILCGNDSSITELIQLKNGNLISGCEHNKIIIWDLIKFRQVQCFDFGSNILGISEMEQKKLIIVTSRSVINMSLNNNKKVILDNMEKNVTINCLLFLESNTVYSTSSNNINIFYTNPFIKIKSLKVNDNIISIKNFIQNYFLAVSKEYTLLFFNVINFEQLLCVNLKTYNFFDVLVFNAKLVYTGSNGGLTEWNSNLVDAITPFIDNIVLA